MEKEFRRVLTVAIVLSVFGVCLNVACAKREDSQIKLSSPASELVRPGGNLQAVLDSGKNLLLEKNGVYKITKTLRYKFDGQKISTKDAVVISDYATLRISDPKLMMLVDGAHKDNIVLENIILDGNRYELSTVAKTETTGGGGQPRVALHDRAVGRGFAGRRRRGLH